MMIGLLYSKKHRVFVLTRALACVVLGALWVGLLGGTTLAAQPLGATHIAAQLISDTPQPKQGSRSTLALVMRPDHGWHGYWENGGDAGFGLHITWNAPTGVSVSSFRYPLPQRLVISGLMNYVYNAPYALLAEITIAPDIPPGTDISLVGKAQWLACTDEICVPEEAVITLPLTVGDGTISPASQAEVRGWQSKLPMPIERLGRWHRTENTLRLAIPLPAKLPITDPYLYVETRQLIDYSAAQSFSRRGDWLIVESIASQTHKEKYSGTVRALLHHGNSKGLQVTFAHGLVPAAGEDVTLVEALSSNAHGGGHAPDSRLHSNPTLPDSDLDDPRSGNIRSKDSPSNIDRVFIGSTRANDSTNDSTYANNRHKNLRGDDFEATHVSGFRASLAVALPAFLGAIIGGLLLNLMPCVFPILSLKVLSLARLGGNAAAGRKDALAYSTGALAMTLLLGATLLTLQALGAQIGWAFQLQNPLSLLLLLALATAITANFAGLYTMPNLTIPGLRLPSIVIAKSATHGQEAHGQKAHGQGESKSPMRGSSDNNSFWVGALAAFVATPCSGPFLGAALGATLLLPAWAAMPIFGGLGLGLALPYLILAYIPILRRSLPRPGPWMQQLQRWLALPMGASALALCWLLWRQAGGLGLVIAAVMVTLSLVILGWLGMRQRNGGLTQAQIGILALLALSGTGILAAAVQAGTLDSASESSQMSESSPYSSVHSPQDATFNPSMSVAPLPSHRPTPFSPFALASAQAQGKAVFVYFTADWCLSCKANEATAINRRATQSAFQASGIQVLVGDWTQGDSQITQYLAAYGRNSVPLYLWYHPNRPDPEILPQILLPAMLISRAQATK